MPASCWHFLFSGADDRLLSSASSYFNGDFHAITTAQPHRHHDLARFYKTLDALQKLQRTRKGETRAVGQAVSPGKPALKAMHAGQTYTSEEMFENGIRSVSQNSTMAANLHEP